MMVVVDTIINVVNVFDIVDNVDNVIEPFFVHTIYLMEKFRIPHYFLTD